MEPAIKTVDGVRCPDIIVYRTANDATVIDPTVVSDLPGELDRAHARKVSKYDKPQIRAWVSELARIHVAHVQLARSSEQSERGGYAEAPADAIRPRSDVDLCVELGSPCLAGVPR